MNKRIIGALAMAQKRCPEVKVFGGAVPSNHMHLLLEAPTAKDISDFMESANGTIAREVGRVHQWRGCPFWSAPYSNLNVLGDEDIVEQLKYLFAQTCKEGLVDDPRKWPGVHVAQPLCQGQFILQGIRIDRTGLYEARRRGEDVTEADFTHEVELRLSKIPPWAHLSDEAYAKRCNELITQICDETKAERSKFLGVKRVLQQSPHGRPKATKRTNKPVCHASDPHTWRWYLFIRNLFRAQYRRAAGVTPLDLSLFPANCFLPGGHYVPA